MRIGDWSSDVCSSDLRFCVHAKRRWGKAMRLGSKAKLTIAVGLTAASAFLALGVRELRNASAATVQGEAAHVRVAAPVLLVRAARAIRTGETIKAAMIRNAPGDPPRYPYAATSAEVVIGGGPLGARGGEYSESWVG